MRQPGPHAVIRAAHRRLGDGSRGVCCLEVEVDDGGRAQQAAWRLYAPPRWSLDRCWQAVRRAVVRLFGRPSAVRSLTARKP